MSLDEVTSLQRIHETMKRAAIALRGAMTVEQLQRETAGLETASDALGVILKQETSLDAPGEANFLDLPE
jgi:hypothetical protein